jgi:dihydroneopterin aldolase
MDKVRILNLKIPARHGVYEFEKDKDGLFELDVEMHTDLSSAGKSDELKDTINYDKVVSVIIEEFTKKDYHLIEAVGDAICVALLSVFPICKVIIKIRKPHAPIMANLNTVEIELVREK